MDNRDFHFPVSVFLMTIRLTDCIAMQLNCPNLPRCICNKDLTTVNCSFAELSSIPDLPSTTQNLILDNNNLTTIPPRAFSQVSRIQSIFMKFNAIESIQPLAFNGLKELTNINLNGNKITELANKSFANIPKLKSLRLSLNKIRQIGDEAFFGSSVISKIFLDFNMLSSVPSVGHQPHLSILDLSSNYMGNATFPLSYRSSYKNLSVDLSYNIELLLDSYSFSALSGSKIIDMDLGGNWIKTWPPGVFDGITVIKNLYLGFSSLSEFSFNSKTFTGMTKVLAMDLAGNSFTTFPKNLPTSLELLNLKDNTLQVISSREIAYLGNLKTLMLANNHITDLYFKVELNSLNVLDISFNNIRGFQPNLSFPLKNLTHLNLAQNHFVSLENNIFDSLTSLRLLDLSDNSIINVQNDVFRCLTSLRVLHLERNNFGACLGINDEQLFSGLENLKELYISNANIKNLSDFVFHDQISLEILNLDTNKISGLGPSLFKFTKHLVRLDISNNSIAVLSESNLRHLINLKEINLAGNPFVCNCELLWFRDWIDSTTIDVKYKETYTCFGPEQWRGKPLLEFTKDTIDCSHGSTLSKYTILGSVFATLVICSVSGIFVYRNRWRLRLRIYLISKRGRAFFRRDQAQPANYGSIDDGEQSIYDAYISSSECDNDWVLHHLLPDIDKGIYDNEFIFGGDFKLYYDPRDFNPGVSQVANIFEHMSRSRKVIVVLTEHYYNGMNEFELDQATALYHDHELEDIIVIKVGDVSVRRVPRNLYSQMTNGMFIEWENNDDAIRTFKENLRERLRGAGSHSDTC